MEMLTVLTTHVKGEDTVLPARVVQAVEQGCGISFCTDRVGRHWKGLSRDGVGFPFLEESKE